MSEAEFKIGDEVRVRTARRRDVHFTVTELTDTHVRATNPRGGEVFYEPSALEHAVPVMAVVADEEIVSALNGGDPATIASSGVIPPPRSWHEPLSGVKIEPHPFEPIDSICKRFKRICDRSGILKDFREREYFISPSDRRRRKSDRARRRRGDTSD